MEYNAKPEVLSPAGSFEMLEAAVRSGADAVYFGAKQFSARRNAENFDCDGIKQAVKYCKIRNVKTYLTLNILCKDSELKAAADLAAEAYNSGIDGIITADLGLAEILYRNLPKLPLHASTQLSVHSPSALAVLKKLGFCRVVAAREMSFSELTELCKKAEELDMTVEVFVHGALCMCLSGQCLLSAFLGSRSGNRGLCAGPCRLPFSAPQGTGYDLSLKDLSLLEHISELEKIGVASLKIEGRMKRPEYAAAATAAFRQAIDDGEADKKIADTLKNVFSRSGFTDGYFTGKIGKPMFGIRTKDDVEAATGAFPYLHGLYRSERQSVAVTAEIEIQGGKPISLTLSDGVNAVKSSGSIPQKARNIPSDYKSVYRNINKLGSTPYYLTDFKCNIDGGLFVSAGELNELRRNACNALDEKRSLISREAARIEAIPEVKNIKHCTTPKIIARFADSHQIPEDISGIDGIILALEDDNLGAVPKGLPLAVDIPRGIASESAISERLKRFKQSGFKTAFCGNSAALEIAEKCGMERAADTGLNIFNSQSAEVIAKLGAKAVTLSYEMLLSDAKRLNSPVPKGIVAYGKTPLMLVKNCPIKNGSDCLKCGRKSCITDRKGIEFPVRCRMGFSEILNPLPIWLADRKDELFGLDFIVLYFTDEDKTRVSQVIKAYNNGLAPDVKYTRGLYYRSVL